MRLWCLVSPLRSRIPVRPAACRADGDAWAIDTTSSRRNDLGMHRRPCRSFAAEMAVAEVTVMDGHRVPSAVGFLA